jgi:hypothetical protein
MRTAITLAWNNLVKARQAEAAEANAARRKPLEDARTKAEAELDQAFGKASADYIASFEKKVQETRAAEAAETEKDKQKALEQSRQKAEAELEQAHRRVGQFSLNQVRGLRDLLLTMPPTTATPQAAAAPSSAGGAR